VIEVVLSETLISVTVSKEIIVQQSQTGQGNSAKEDMFATLDLSQDDFTEERLVICQVLKHNT
jgi:hypothetical protein